MLRKSLSLFFIDCDKNMADKKDWFSATLLLFVLVIYLVKRFDIFVHHMGNVILLVILIILNFFINFMKKRWITWRQVLRWWSKMFRNIHKGKSHTYVRKKIYHPTSNTQISEDRISGEKVNSMSLDGK